MGNLKQTRTSRNRKHSAVGKPNRGSAIFRTFIACVTAFALMMPITATAAIGNNETGFDPETFEAPATDTVDNAAGAGEGETGDEPSDVVADGEAVAGDEGASTDADETGKEKADGTDTDKDGKDAKDEDAKDKDGKDAKDDKDAKDSEKGTDKDKGDQDADGEAADKTPEIVESKGVVNDEAEDADDEASDEEDADDEADEAKKMPAQSFEASLTTENGASLKVSVEAPKGAFPLNTTMKVTSVQSADVPDAVEAAVSTRTDDDVVDMQAVDISFKDEDGEEIEPAKKVTVTFKSDLISGTSCVVHLEGTTPAGGKYESYAELTYGPGGTGSVVVKHIPAGTKLTITEEYSGAGYDRDTKTLTATIEADKTVTPDDGGQFVNTPNDDVVRGHGIQNNFELMENGDWEFTASRPVQNQE